MLEKIKKWLTSQPDIQASILVGSDVRTDHPADQYSDYDIEIYSDAFLEYANSERWLQELGSVWICVREMTNEDTPARLVIFEGGYKVDFSLFPLKVIENNVSSGVLPEIYGKGYEFLIDKNSYEDSFKKLKFTSHQDDLSEKEFHRIIEEFWFEVWHVAKYLKRGDLWTAKFRDNETKKFLLQMIEWHTKSIHGKDSNTWHQGKFMKEWVDNQTWEELQNVYGHFDTGDGWTALQATMGLFRRLGTETAKKMGFTYPENTDKKISAWVKDQQN